MKTKIVKKKRINVARTLVFVLFVYIIVCICIYVYKEPVRHYSIVGNEIVGDNDIIRLLGLENYPPMISINVKSLEKKLQKNEFIKSVDIKYGWNFKLKINVEEFKPMFVLKSTNKVVLSNGEVVDNNDFIGIPILLNTTPNEVMIELSNKLSLVNDGVRYLISEIEYAPSYDSKGRVIDNGRFLLSMSDRNMVYVTAKRANVLNKYLSIISNYKIQNNGTLFLDDKEKRYPFKYAKTTEPITQKVQDVVQEDVVTEGDVFEE